MDIRNDVIKKIHKSFKRLPNFAGMGQGKRLKNNQITDEDVIHVFVRQKIPHTTLKPNEIIPKEIRTKINSQAIPTDVIEIGTLKAYDNQSVFRPILGGISGFNAVANADIHEQFAGTLSGIFFDTTDNKAVILSCNHVLARENLAEVGENIEQPSAPDNGGTHALVGTLKRFIIIQPEPANNTIDAAIADINLSVQYDLAITHNGLCRSTITNPTVGLHVQKSGRTTEQTFGQIISTGASISVDYTSFTADFQNQIVTTPIISPGDSGSLLTSAETESNGALVGLGFAGSDQVGIFSPINLVFQQLNIEAFTLVAINKYRDPYRGEFLFKIASDFHSEPSFPVHLGFAFMLYPLNAAMNNTIELKRWKTSSYPYRYVLRTASPGAGWTEDETLGLMLTTQLTDTVPLYEILSQDIGFLYYTIDPNQDNLPGELIVSPTPIGYVANIKNQPSN